MACRPRQWLKNVLVVAAPAAAGVLLQPRVLLRTLLAVVAFALVSSACYLVNDVRDRDADRLHPRKRLRPVAAGTVSTSAALALAAVLAVGGLTLSAAVSDRLLAVVALYLGLTLAYGLGVKDVPWLELAVLASGFVLRCLAGAAATGVTVSLVFVVLSAAAALHLGASKRASETLRLGALGDRHRPVLAAYGLKKLRVVRIVTALTALVCFALWALAQPSGVEQVSAELAIVPLAVVLARWMRRTDLGLTDAPEDVVLTDRVVQVGAACWGVLFLLSVVLA